MVWLDGLKILKIWIETHSTQLSQSYTGTVANPSPITFLPTFNESVSFISVCFTDLRPVTGYWWDCCTAAIHGYLDVSLFFLFNTDFITVVQYFLAHLLWVSQLLFCVLYIYVLFFPILISLWSLREPPKPSSLYLRWQHSYSLSVVVRMLMESNIWSLLPSQMPLCL